MAKLRLTFEVDNIQLFDTLKSMNSDAGPIGARVIGAMMDGKPGFADQVGMAVYGIALKEVKELQ